MNGVDDVEDDAEVWYFSDFYDIDIEMEDENIVNDINCNLGKKNLNHQTTLEEKS